MPNTWFQFKQFKIEQSQCGMKVSTDACILGAIAADFLAISSGIKTILDIGTGTGILSLMIAQKTNNNSILALEIEEDAYLQAKDNFKNSVWKERLNTIHSCLQTYISTSSNKNLQFDFIICNPPFFQNHLQAVQTKRNKARHNISLTSDELLYAMERLLSKGGQFCVLYPEVGWTDFIKLAERYGCHLKKEIKIRPNAKAGFNRNVAFFTKEK